MTKKNVKIIQQNCLRIFTKFIKIVERIFPWDSHVGFCSEIAEASQKQITKVHKKFLYHENQTFYRKVTQVNACHSKSFPVWSKGNLFSFQGSRIKQFWGNSRENLIHKIVWKGQTISLSCSTFEWMFFTSITEIRKFLLEFTREFRKLLKLVELICFYGWEISFENF